MGSQIMVFPVTVSSLNTDSLALKGVKISQKIEKSLHVLAALISDKVYYVTISIVTSLNTFLLQFT
jgi:hypothetical protein